MLTIKIIFWILIFIVFYTYLGYGMVLYLLILMKRFFENPSKALVENIELPEVTLFIAAYNEKDFVEDQSGSDLDVPGSELDDEQEKIGSEDEENNYYSLGGDGHTDLDEDKGG